jgi:hypothetical protein
LSGKSYYGVEVMVRIWRITTLSKLGEGPWRTKTRVYTESERDLKTITRRSEQRCSRRPGLAEMKFVVEELSGGSGEWVEVTTP